MTDAEIAVVNLLADAANAYGKLPYQHPSELSDFVFYIHGAQTLVMARCARERHPETFPTYSKPTRPVVRTDHQHL